MSIILNEYSVGNRLEHILWSFRRAGLRLHMHWERHLRQFWILPVFCVTLTSACHDRSTVALGANHAPVAKEDAATTLRAMPVTLNVCENDNDPDGDPLSVETCTKPAHGTVTLIAGLLRYTPNNDYIGSDRFEYTVGDGRGGAARAIVSLKMIAPNSIWYVSVNGNDSATGSKDAPFRTLNHAVRSAVAGDEIVLRQGTHRGGITIEQKDISIREFPGEQATVAAPIDDAQIIAALYFRAAGGRVIGLDVIGGYNYTVKFDGGSSLIEDAKLHGSGQDVVKIVPGADDITIRKTEIFDSGLRDGSNAEGIDNVNGDRTLIQDCHIHDIATTGVYLKGGAIGGVIERTRVEHCGWSGLQLGFYTDTEFLDTSANPEYSENIDGTIRNCIISDTVYSGIGLYAAFNARIYNNTLVGVAKGGQAGILICPVEHASRRIASRKVELFNNIVQVSGSQPALQIREGGLTGPLSAGSNRYYAVGRSSKFADDTTRFFGGLPAWQRHIHADAGSTEGDPVLDGKYRLRASSPCVDAGRFLRDVASDIDDQERKKPWDIGADELNGQ